MKPPEKIWLTNSEARAYEVRQGLATFEYHPAPVDPCIWSCGGEMNPPEKIYFNPDLNCMGTQPIRGGYEYHLAPVWHDAKTDPPKVGSYYLTFQRGYPMSVDYFILHEGKSIFEEGEPDYWMPLPEPPKESENV